MTAWNLLEAAALGNARAGALYQEYARAVAGKPLLRWQPGAAGVLGLQTGEEGGRNEK
jgi:hypothetical protein